MSKVNDHERKFNTNAIHTGSEHCPVTGAHIAPIYRTSTFVMNDVEEAIAAGYGDPEGEHYAYTRYGNPTVHAVQRKIAILEGAEAALMTASGMAAISTALMAELKAGDHVIAADNVYGGTYGFMKKILPKFGVEVTFINTKGDSIKNIEEVINSNTKIIYVETPSNPILSIIDLEKVSEIAKSHNLLMYVDNTFATPYLQQPIKLGADIVLHSTTKYLNGHGDMVGGAIVGVKKLIHKFDTEYLKWIGAIMSPADAASLSKGIKTLGIRMDVHSSNAMTVALFLEQHEMVEKVFYPGLKSHKGHEIAKKQMKNYGGMMSFNVKGGFEAGKQLMNSVELFSLATSLGNIDSLIQHSASMSHASLTKEEREHAGIDDGQVRLSIGIENIEDIIEDLNRALDKVKTHLDR